MPVAWLQYPMASRECILTIPPITPLAEQSPARAMLSPATWGPASRLRRAAQPEMLFRVTSSALRLTVLRLCQTPPRLPTHRAASSLIAAQTTLSEERQTAKVTSSLSTVAVGLHYS